MNLEEYLSDFMKDYLTESKTSLSALNTILQSNDISFVVIGGMATIRYNYNRTTDDIDILVDKKDKSKMDNLPIGFIRKISDKWFMLHEPKNKVEVIYSGEISGDGKNGLEFPKPSEITEIKEGIPYISLIKLIEFKLSSGIYGKRLQDFGDIQKLIRINKLSKEYASKFREDLKNKYIEIWNSAQDEIVI